MIRLMVRVVVLGALWGWVSCGMGAEMGEIVDSFRARRAALEAVDLRYSVREIRFGVGPVADAIYRADGSRARAAVTTGTVEYKFKDGEAEFVSDLGEENGARRKRRIVWRGGKREVFEGRALGLETGGTVSEDETFGGDDVGVFQFWCFVGFTPKWMKLEGDFVTEYNFAERDFSRARVEREDGVTSVTFDGRETFVFKGVRLMEYERRRTEGGWFVRYRCVYREGSDAGALPCRVEVDDFSDDGQRVVGRREYVVVGEGGCGGNF